MAQTYLVISFTYWKIYEIKSQDHIQNLWAKH